MEFAALNPMEVESYLARAERLMVKGRWGEAEAIFRECCPDQADLTLRLAQLEMRRECARYAHAMRKQCGSNAIAMQTHCERNANAMPEDSASIAEGIPLDQQALSILEEKFDYYSALWVLTKYKGE